MLDEDDKEDPSAGGGARPTGMAYAMRTEAEAVLGDAAFRRSPTIARLFRFLIEETLAGRAHLLKSYTVAVDGLGRPADFDVGDSYARVQMGRLRKMLQSYYSEHGPVAELCLYLQHGSYVVKIAKLATAYPMLYRPLSAASPATARTSELVPNNTAKSKQRIWLRKWHLGLLAGIALTLLTGVLWQAIQPAQSAGLSPILELGTVDAGQGQDAAELAAQIDAMFENGLPRFKIARVRLIARGRPVESPTDAGLVYRMHSQIESREGGSATLMLRLSDFKSNTLIWSREIDILPEPGAQARAIIPLLSEIAGPHGVIATQSAIEYKDNHGGGFPCLLQYFAFLNTRELATEKRVADCFEKPVAEAYVRANILASRAFFALESRSGLANPKAALIKARKFADQSLVEDANSGAARFAMARIAYIDGDCMTARYYTQQTVEANPYSPIFMSALAANAPQCRYEKSSELLDEAFLIAKANDTDARLLLVIAAIAQGRADRIDDLDQINVPRNGRNLTNYYLSEAIVSASRNKNSEAKMYWRLFVNATANDRRGPPEEMLRQISISPVLRGQVLAHLQRHNVF